MFLGLCYILSKIIVLLSVAAAAVVKHFSEKSRVLVEGESLELECRTWGYPIPHVKWTRLSRSDSDAVEIASGERVTLSDIDSVTNARLTITDMSVDDYGTYTCVANNGIGNESDSEAILIRVKGITILPTSAGSNTAFLPARRYASAFFATATCLSVCPSVTRRYYA